MAKKLTKIVFLASSLLTVSTLLTPIFVEGATLQGGDPFQDNERTNINKQVFREPHPVNGAYIYEYELNLPLGRNGLEPKLSLTYTSQNNSNVNPFGYGWDINIPSIERIPRKGSDHLYDGTANFFYSSFDGEVIASSTDSNTEDYGPLVQNENFRKYEFVDNTWWRVTDKKGVVYKFGQATSTRQTNPDDDYETFKWMLEEVRDQNDNYISYFYYKDDGQIYPLNINYTGNDSTDGIFDIDFTREGRDDIATSTLAGFPVVSNYRISQIQAEINSSWVRKYELGYTTGDNGVRSLLDTITETGRDEDLNTLSLPATNFDYQTQITTASTTWTEDTSYSLTPTFVENGHDEGVRIIDVNGDGLADVLKGNNQSACAGSQDKQVYINDGDGIGWTLNPNYELPAYFVDCYSTDFGVRILDIDADGFPDLVRSWDNGQSVFIKKVWINNTDNTGWTEDINYSTTTIPVFSEMGNDKGVRVLDVNGDGLPDLVQSFIDTSGPAIKGVYINDGDGTGWTEDTNYSTSTIPIFIQNVSDLGVRIADINGDTLPDFIQSVYLDYPPISKVYINKGDGTGWYEDSNYNVNGLPYFIDGNGDEGVRIADMNGDGLSDVIRSYNPSCCGLSPIRQVYINDGDGTGWTLDNNYALPTFFTEGPGRSDYGVRLVDLDGDNIPDFIRGYFGSPTYKQMWIGNAVNSDLLSQITTDLGAIISVDYTTSAQTSGNQNLPLNLTVVSSVGENDGFGNIATTTYSYQGGAYHYSDEFDKKFAGFATTTIIDAVGNVTKNFFHQGNGSQTSIGEYSDDICKIGKIYRTEIYDNSSNLFKKIINKWENFALSNDRDFVKNTRTVTYDYDGDGDHKDTAIEKIYDDSIGNVTQIVNFGEVTGSDDGTFADVSGDTSTTTISYATSTSYIHSLPRTKIITGFDGATSTEDRYYYDSQSLGTVTTGNLTKQESWVSGSNYIDNEWTYDGTYGLIIQKKDPRDKATNYTYDGYNFFVATSTNPLNQTTEYYYDYSSGKVKKTVNSNNKEFETIYDALDRIKIQKIPDLSNPTSLVNKTEFTYTDTIGSRRIKETNYLNSATSSDKYTYLDGLDRKIQERAETESSDIFSVKDYQYDDRSLLYKQSLPYQSTGSSKTSITTVSSLLNTFTHDTLERIKTIINSKGTESYVYDQRKTTITDRENNQKDFTKDAYDNLVQVEEHNDASTYTTLYDYDLNKNLVKITDALDNVRNFNFDGLNRLTKSEDIHDSVDTTVGSTTLVYDYSGNVTSKMIPSLDMIDYTYDDINRVLTEDSDGSGGTEITYGYDWCDEGAGKLCSATTTDVITKYEYNAVGNIAKEIKEIGEDIFETVFDYDRQGNKTQIVYPDGSDVVYLYNTAGLLDKVLYSEVGTSTYSTIIDNFGYHSSGQKNSINFGNGVETNYTYSTTSDYKIEKIDTKATTTALMDGGNFALATNLFGKIGSYLKRIVLGTEISSSNNVDYIEMPNLEEDWSTGLKVGKDINISDSQLKKFVKRGWNYISRPVVVDATKDGKKIKPVEYETEFHTKWVNYKTSNGWKEINTDFIQTENGFEMKDAPFEVYLPAKSTGTAVMRNNNRWDVFNKKVIEEDPIDMSIQALDVNEVYGKLKRGDLIVPTGLQKDVSYVIYEGAYPEGDLIYYVDFGRIPRLEKLVKINSEPSKLDYSFELSYSDDVSWEKYNKEDGDKKEKWSKEKELNASAQDFVKINKKNSDVRGFGLYEFKIWDSDLSYLDPPEVLNASTSVSEIKRNITSINVSIISNEDDSYRLTKELPADFFNASTTYPVYTDTVTTFYPDANTENTSVDGVVMYHAEGGGISWNQVRVASTGSSSQDSSAGGGEADVSPTTYTIAGVRSSTYPAFSISRGIFLFDTSAIGTDEINSATFSFFCPTNGKSMSGLEPSFGVHLVSSNPASNTAIVNSDYDYNDFGITDLASSISYSDVVTNSYNNFELNSTGLSLVDSGGITKLGTRHRYDKDDYDPGSTRHSNINSYFADNSGTSNDPKLVVTHIVANENPIAPTSLETENQTNPTGLLDGAPEFSAIYNDPDEGDLAGDYQLQVSTSTDFTTIYWDSGKTVLSTTTSEGSRSEEISYAGNSLASSTPYYWRIKFWDIYDEGIYSTTTASFSLNSAPSEPTNLLVEEELNVTGVIDKTPEFSAIYNDSDSNSFAKYYRIQVATSSDYWGYPYWDSTKTLLTSSTTPGNRISDISYSGNDLATSTTYYWRIKFWDDGDFEGSWSTATSSLTTITPGIQTIFFDYDNVGNIYLITDISNGGLEKTIQFLYDSLYRLTTASTTDAYSNPFNQTYTYNAIGNITNKSDQGGYTYGETGYANPHAVTNINGSTYTYDNNGNITGSGSDTFSWDYKNRLISSVVNSNADYYSYDHNNIRTTKTNNTATTTYPNMYYNTDGTTVTKHIFDPITGDLLATVEGNGTATTTNYIHTDHLGGTNVVTDENGEVKEVTDYYPFGEQRINTGTFTEQRKFTGHEFDEENDLTYAKQRYYDQDVGRWLSQDPAFLFVGTQKLADIMKVESKNNGDENERVRKAVEQYLSNPQQLNSYSYTNNNPVNLIDSQGEFGLPGAMIGGFVGGTFTAIGEYVSDVKETGGYSPQSDLSTAFMKGFTGGAIAGGTGLGIFGYLGGAFVSDFAFEFGDTQSFSEAMNNSSTELIENIIYFPFMGSPTRDVVVGGVDTAIDIHQGDFSDKKEESKN